jgi:2,3-bisphosphoglycerate-dependent phosphoglycerate mutase
MILNLSETKNVLVVAHGNSIRAILKIIEDISDKDIIGINIPTGIPLAFNYQDDKLTKIGYLGDQEQIIKLQKEVEQQSRIKKG